MYPNPIPLNDGTVEINYDYRGTDVNTGSIYKDATAPLDQARTVRIRHTTANESKSSEVRSTNIQITRVVENAEGVQGSILSNITIRIPTKVATVAQVTEELNQLKDFLTNAGYIDKIIAAEV